MNLPDELCEWIDKYVAQTTVRPIGAQSRDEFVRIAVALVIMSTRAVGDAVPPLKILADLIRRLEE